MTADIGIQLQKTVEDLANLRGQVETYLYKIGELEAALGKLTADAEKKQLAQQGADAHEGGRGQEAGRGAQAARTDKKEFLALAEEKAKAGELAAGAPALLGVHEEVGQGSAGGRGALRHGRDVLRGGASAARRSSSTARCIQDFPKTPSAPEAYLRSSDCFGKLKMTEESRLALEELVKSYPKSDAAKTAKTQLAELDKAKKPAPKPAPAPAPEEGKQMRLRVWRWPRWRCCWCHSWPARRPRRWCCSSPETTGARSPPVVESTTRLAVWPDERR